MVVATGGFHVPHRPPIAERVPGPSSTSIHRSTATRRPCRRARCSSWDRDSRASRSPRSSRRPGGGSSCRSGRGPVPASLPRERHLPLAGRPSRAGRGAGDTAADGGQAGRPAPSAGRESALLGARWRSRHEPAPVRGGGDDAARSDRSRRRSATPSRSGPGGQPDLGRPVLRRALPRPLRRVHRAAGDRRPA